MTIAIGCDHAGYEYKEQLLKYFESKDIDFVDCGTFSTDSCDYPDYAKKVGYEVASNNVDYGVLICGSGEGISIAANKVPGVRCGIGYNDEVAALIRQHNNANVIAFGARFMTLDEVIKRIEIFLNTEFMGGRHTNRVEKIEN